MWLLFAFASAFFAGVTSILAKCGIKNTDSNVATAIRTIIILIFSCLMVFIVGSQSTIKDIETKTWIFLILSGLSIGASWLCYFQALQLGNINKVVPIDKSSTILTILLALLFLGEEISWLKAAAIIAIAVGSYFMIQRKREEAIQNPENKSWFLYALLSAVFASLTAILVKIGIQEVESNLGSSIRTVVVLLMAWLLVLVSKKYHTIRRIPGKELCFICLSGLSTGASWLCYYKALQGGPASIVVPIDKLSILVTIVFSYFVFKERLSKTSAFGLLLLTVGTLALLIPS